MWRELNDLFPLMGAEQRTGGPPSSSSPSSLLGVRSSAPAAVAFPEAAAANPFCGVLGCDQYRSTGRYCDAHDEAYRARAYDLTRDIGRGDLP